MLHDTVTLGQRWRLWILTFIKLYNTSKAQVLSRLFYIPTRHFQICSKKNFLFVYLLFHPNNFDFANFTIGTFYKTYLPLLNLKSGSTVPECLLKFLCNCTIRSICKLCCIYI